MGAKQRFEKIAVVCIAPSRAAELKAGSPIGRRTKILARRMSLSQLIVGGPLLRSSQHLVGLADLLETGFGVLLLADVRVIFTSELAVGLLDLRLGGIARHTHDLVVVLELHRAYQYANRRSSPNTIARRTPTPASLATVDKQPSTASPRRGRAAIPVRGNRRGAPRGSRHQSNWTTSRFRARRRKPRRIHN